LPFVAAIASSLGFLLGLGLVERVRRDRAWKAVPIRIHVNGTRGKSTVTRLIWAALREAGIPALGKTTGAGSRLLLPDGSELPLARRGKANIREQLRALLLAKKMGARAAVLECMALAPELQWVAERSMVGATIGVITNARTDHTEVMGYSTEEIAGCLSNTIPPRSVLVLGDPALESLFSPRASELGTRIEVAPAASCIPDMRGDAAGHPDTAASFDLAFAENLATALAVTRLLDITDRVALEGMRHAPSDPGASCAGTVRFGEKTFPYLDARSANDPESFKKVFDLFLAGIRPSGTATRAVVMVFNHRADRPHRIMNFVAMALPWAGGSLMIITGERPPLLSWQTIRRRSVHLDLRFVPHRRLPAALAGLAPGSAGFVFCGNTRGLDLDAILKAEAYG
jgi:poly-gamma-glutamate synthase PgsB/CapB